MALDTGLLIAGAKERGELESRITSILADAASTGDVIFMCAAAYARSCACRSVVWDSSNEVILCRAPLAVVIDEAHTAARRRKPASGLETSPEQQRRLCFRLCGMPQRLPTHASG